jgi:hypothetical protein
MTKSLISMVFDISFSVLQEEYDGVLQKIPKPSFIVFAYNRNFITSSFHH